MNIIKIQNYCCWRWS